MSSPSNLENDKADATKEGIDSPNSYGLRQWLGWFLGPAALLFTLLVAPPEGLSLAGWQTAGCAILMAVFWVCESIPISATALLPLILFPALKLGKINDTCAPFADPIIYMFLGGFIIALAMQRWGLHRRIAIHLISIFGTKPSQLVGGILLATSIVSMWVSNTSTALMMLPVALSIIPMMEATSQNLESRKAFALALMLSVAYGATIGGMATLIGTPPNALLAAHVKNVYHIEIGFGQWMLIGVPVMLATLPVVYLFLTRICFKLESTEIVGMSEFIQKERANLGPWSRGEISVLVIFALTVVGWLFMPILKNLLPMLNDTTIAITGGLALFFIPSNFKRGEFLMNWSSMKNLPWDVLILFGGGLSLANHIEKHGLSNYLVNLCNGLEGFPIIVILAILCFSIIMLGELTSNTATVATLLPIVGALATSLGQNPLLLIVASVLAANCSFMLPAGTPPNAIVFATGHITLPQMAKVGLWLNVLMVPIIICLMLLLGQFVFGIELGVIPSSAR